MRNSIFCAAVLAAAAARAQAGPVSLSLGTEGGGPPFLSQPDGPVANTTATASLSLFARFGVPSVSTRVIEVAVVPHHGYSFMLQSGDLHLYGARVRLFDLGLVYNASDPITVSRVARRWDVTVGVGLELPISRHLCLVADARMFAPLDIWSVVTQYGDTARLIGDEILHGVQVWGGGAVRW